MMMKRCFFASNIDYISMFVCVFLISKLDRKSFTYTYTQSNSHSHTFFFQFLFQNFKSMLTFFRVFFSTTLSVNLSFSHIKKYIYLCAQLWLENYSIYNKIYSIREFIEYIMERNEGHFKPIKIKKKFNLKVQILYYD